MSLSTKLEIATAPKPRAARRSPTRGRRVEIADAALCVLAREGSRGLTHRRVDSLLAIAEGSTSAYYRTRTDLLAAAANRLCELDLKDARRQMRFAVQPPDQVDASYIAGRLAATFADWLLEGKRERTLARCELFLEANRDAELQKIMARTQTAFCKLTAGFLRALGAEQPAEGAQMFVDFALGLLHGCATSFSPPLSRPALKQLVEAALSWVMEQTRD